MTRDAHQSASSGPEERPGVAGAAREVVWQWLEEGSFTWAAAIAFYTVFSPAPILVIATAVAGVVWPGGGIRGELHTQFEQAFGAAGSHQIESMIDHSGVAEGGWWPTAVGIGAMTLGATAVFGTLRSALDAVWNVKEPHFSWRTLVWQRALSFALVLGIAFLLIVSLVVSATLVAAGRWVESHTSMSLPVLRIVNIVVSWMVLFAAIFQVVPDVRVAWKDVWVGAVSTSLRSSRRCTPAIGVHISGPTSRHTASALLSRSTSGRDG